MTGHIHLSLGSPLVCGLYLWLVFVACICLFVYLSMFHLPDVVISNPDVIISVNPDVISPHLGMMADWLNNL